MLLTIAGAIAVATAIVVAAHAARERRALGTEVRALRGELRELAAARGPARPSGDDHIGPRPFPDPDLDEEDGEPLQDESGAAAAHGDPSHFAQAARGSRTLH